MHRQCSLGGRQRPDVEMVRTGHPGQFLERARHLVGLDRLGCSGKRHRGGFGEQAPRPPQDHRRDDQADHRVDPRQTGAQDQETGDHDRRRHHRVRRHMEERAADIDVVVPPAREQPGGDPVDQYPDCRDGHHHIAVRRFGMDQSADRLGDDPADRDQQQQGIDQRGEDRAFLEAIGKARARPPLDQRSADERHHQPEHVGQIMPRVGQQRHRIGREAIDRLDHDEAEIEQDADDEGGAETGTGRMIMSGVIVARSHNSRIASGLGASSDCNATQKRPGRCGPGR